MNFLLRRNLPPSGIQFSPRHFQKASLCRARNHHSTTARLITLSPAGIPAVREIEVWLGDAKNAYVMFDPEIGRAFQFTGTKEASHPTIQYPELSPLDFNHDTNHFCHRSSLHPRLEIPKGLPKQSKGNSSPATLHAYGHTHAIALDGTPDASFHHSLRESQHRLGPVLEELKKT